MTTCNNCPKPGRVTIRDVPGGESLWCCGATECRAEALAVVCERDGMRENDGRLPPKEPRRER